MSIQVITAPSQEEANFTSVFLAGGITNCKEWQKEVINNLKHYELSVYNPRQEHFDILDKKASYNQILWEFERLEKCDIFSMYFCNDNSDQPICMYELGRNVLRMQQRFPNDWKYRIIISVEDGYKRASDVIIQTELCAPKLIIYTAANPSSHAEFIVDNIRRLKI